MLECRFRARAPHVLPHTKIGDSDGIPDKLLSRICTCSDHSGGSYQEGAFEPVKYHSKGAKRLPKSARIGCADFGNAFSGLDDAIGVQRE